ncbi:serine/threonine-protein phosphatase 6 regulatory ankyrin repeat subunit B-like [Halyomorpha halys]|uniref:serine/threonine-protein phosphatase 6 regulatory ankyrin repeat subunit B-like n=1 Tax=Halyomorpha halys TaxID=286706 RepID=UPI0034D3136C
MVYIDKGRNTENKFRRTPLYYTLSMNYENYENIVNLTNKILYEQNEIPNYWAIDDLFEMYNELNRNRNIVIALLNYTVTMNNKTSFEHTPLHIAVMMGDDNIVSFMLEKNASVNAKDKMNYAPIHYAAVYNRFNAMKKLLDYGAFINSREDVGRTALHIASLAGYENIVHLLLERNASLGIKDMVNNAPLHDAVSYGNLNDVKKHINIKDITSLLIWDLDGLDKMLAGEIKKNDAVSNENLKVVKKLLDHGGSIDSQGEFGRTPLHIAARKGQETIVNLLLARNASVDIRDAYHDAAIHHAMMSKNLKIVIQLLEYGANVNTKGATGNTPFGLAISINSNNLNESRIILNSIDTEMKNKHSEKIQTVEVDIINVMRTLIQRGADVNSKNTYDQTALHEAAEIGYDAVAGYLLSQNASLGIQDYICYAPLHRAANNLNIDVLKTLLDYGDNINRTGCNNITALHLAIERNNTKLTEFLLSNNADPNVMSEEGYTPLDVAFLKSSEEIINLLLDKGAKVEDNSFLRSKILFDAISKKVLKLAELLLNRTENFESYPTVILNYAIGMNFIEEVKLLIKYGANIEKKDIHGNLPLSSAVMSKNVNLVELILKESTIQVASKNFTTFINAYSQVMFITSKNNASQIHNLTALHIASYHGLTEIVQLLITNKASLEVRDERGYTPLHYACEEGHVEVVELLSHSGANKDSADINGTTPLHIACRLGSLPIARLLLSHPIAALDYADNDGYTAVHYAAFSGSQKIVKLLLNLGANKEARTNGLKTPLHFASFKGHNEIVEMLLKEQADFKTSDIEGMMPLHYAVKERQSNVVKLLVQYGLSPLIRNKNGSTPLHLACQRHDKSTKSEKDIVSNLTEVLYGYVNPLNFDLMTPLHIGSRDNSSGCVEVLLSHGGDQNGRDKFLNLPIHYAALNGNLEIILMLLRKDRRLGSSVNSNEETPLFLAAREGHTNVVALILEYGIHGLRPDVKGRNALHRSASRGHLEIVKLLRQHRANKEKEDNWGFTALNYGASWRGHQEVIGYLSDTSLNITLTSYLQRSNPFQT